MRVLLDANVVVAAFASRGLCEAVFEVCLDAHDIVMSDELLREVARSLRKKIKLPRDTVDAIAGLLQENCTFHQPVAVETAACRDPNDLHVLGLAVAAKAECIVTGDRDLLAVRKAGRCRILSPRQFSDLIHKRRPRRPRRPRHR